MVWWHCRRGPASASRSTRRRWRGCAPTDGFAASSFLQPKGHLMTASQFSWPHGKRVAVLISLLLESWAEGKSPSYFTRTAPLRGGAVDHAGVQWSTYGGKEGIWRLVRTLDLCHPRGSVFCNARSAELYPDAVKQIVKSGHLVEGHGYSQDQYLLEMTPEVQKATIA